MSKNTFETNVVKPKLKFFVGEDEKFLLSTEDESTLDSKIKEIEDYMTTNNSGEGLTDEQKDTLYQGAQDLWREYSNTLNSTRYNFFLNRRQYMFLTDLILTKLDYDVNTVFFAIQLKDTMFNLKKNSNYTNDNELIGYAVNATEITYIYHLIQTHKVRGLNDSAYRFSEVLMEIGSISKIFNYYDNVGKNLSAGINSWVLTLDPLPTLETETLTEATEKVKTTKKRTTKENA